MVRLFPTKNPVPVVNVVLPVPAVCHPLGKEPPLSMYFSLQRTRPLESYATSQSSESDANADPAATSDQCAWNQAELYIARFDMRGVPDDAHPEGNASAKPPMPTLPPDP